MQKGLATGRSSYVEMRALERLTHHNIRTRVNAISLRLPKEVWQKEETFQLLLKVPWAVSSGYADVLTPNGIVRKEELDRLLSIDSEIVICLSAIESNLESHNKCRDVAGTLRELIEERRKLVGSLKA